MSDMTLSIAEQDACLVGFTGGDGMGAKIRLFTNDVQPTKSSVLADFTLPTNTGTITAVVVTWSAPYTDVLQREVVQSSIANFIASAIVAPETIFGWIIEDSTGMHYLGGGRLDVPVPITVVGDGVSVSATLPYGG